MQSDTERGEGVSKGTNKENIPYGQASLQGITKQKYLTGDMYKSVS